MENALLSPEIIPTDPTPGEQLKEEALGRLDALRADALEYIRGELIARLQQRGADGFVTADDAAEIYDAWPERDGTLPRAFLGAVFRGDKRFAWTGQLVKSSQIQNHARLLYCWRLADSRALEVR